MTGHIKIFFQKLNGARVRGDVANLSTFAMHAKMFYAFAVGKIFCPKSTEFGTPERVKKQHRQNCTVTSALELVALWGFEIGRASCRERV